jgi:hypothetical protein
MIQIFERVTGKKVQVLETHKKAGMNYSLYHYAVGLHPLLG